MPEAEEEIEIHILAERIKLLFGFCAELIPSLPLLKKVAVKTNGRVSTSMAIAPIMGAMGMDWEEKQFYVELEARRADALYNLVLVLDETEKDRVKFLEAQAKKREGQEVIKRILG